MISSPAWPYEFLFDLTGAGLRQGDEFHVDDDVFVRVHLEVDHVAGRQMPAEVGTLDLKHHLHRAKETLDGVMVESGPAPPWSDGPDHAVAGENPFAGVSSAVAWPGPSPRTAETSKSVRLGSLISSTLSVSRPRAA